MSPEERADGGGGGLKAKGRASKRGLRRMPAGETTSQYPYAYTVCNAGFSDRSLHLLLSQAHPAPVPLT